MARPRKVEAPIEAPIEVVPAVQTIAPAPESIPAPVTVESKPLAPAVPVPQRVSVGVRNRCPWAVVQSAGTPWGRAGTILKADDPRLPELRRCEWLIVTEV